MVPLGKTGELYAGILDFVKPGPPLTGASKLLFRLELHPGAARPLASRFVEKRGRGKILHGQPQRLEQRDLIFRMTAPCSTAAR